MIRDWPGYNKKYRTLIGHIYYWEQRAKNLGIRIEDTDAIKTDNWGNLSSVNLESFKNTGPPIHSQINVYTDGSRTEEPVGSRYVTYHKGEELEKESIRLEEETTVFQADVLAIKLSIQRLINIRKTEHKFIKIFSDSQAALRALVNWKIK